MKSNYIHPTAVIHPDVVIGEGNWIGPHCIIGFPAEHKAFRESGKKGGTVIIGNNNHIEGLVTIDGGTEHDTYIGDNCWLLKHSHVGHDCIIHDGVTISCGAKVGGHTVVEDGCNLGLNCTIHQKQRIKKGCMVGMGAAVTKGLITEPNQKYAGVPAKWIGVNKK